MVIGVLNKLEMLDEISSYVDGLVVYSNDFSSFYDVAFNEDEILNIIKKSKKQIIVDISFMMENEKIESVTNFILKFKDYNNLFLYSDLGIHQILLENQMEYRGIYNPSTLITNSYDMNFYLKQNMNAISLSIEVPDSNLWSMVKNKEGKVFLFSFGYPQMFHSKRHLISLYKEKYHKDFNINHNKMYLIEEKREDKYPIDETNYGTILYRSYIVSYLLEAYNYNIDYVFLSPRFIEEDIYLKVLKIYYNTLNHIIPLNDGLKEIEDLKLNILDGFKEHDTVYQKEEF